MNAKQVVAERTVPYNLDAEQAVLGSCMIDPDAIMQVAGLITSADFYRETHQWIFDALLSLSEQDIPADTLTLSNELEARGQLDECGGLTGLMELYSRVPTAIHAQYYARLVQKSATMRRLVGAAEKIAKLAYSPGENDQGTIRALAEGLLSEAFRGGVRTDPRLLRETLWSLLDDLQALREGDKRAAAMPSSLNDLNGILGGYHPGEQTVLVARPAIGKTSLATQEAWHLAQKGYTVLLFSLEMNEKSLNRRLAARAGRIPLQRLRLGLGEQAADEEWEELLSQAAETVGQLGELPIYVDTQPSQSAYEIRAKAKMLATKLGGVHFIVVDYLGLIRTDGRGKIPEHVLVGEAAKSMRELARELNAHMLLLHQLNREGARGTPALHQIRDSGQIEQHADVVLALHDPEMLGDDDQPRRAGPSTKQILVLKSRNGDRGYVEAVFDGPYQEWRDAAPAYVAAQEPPRKRKPAAPVYETSTKEIAF